MSDAPPYKPLPTIATPISREDRDGFMALSMDEFCSVSSFALIQLLAQRYEATIRKLESAPSLTREAVEALRTPHAPECDVLRYPMSDLDPFACCCGADPYNYALNAVLALFPPEEPT